MEVFLLGHCDNVRLLTSVEWSDPCQLFNYKLVPRNVNMHCKYFLVKFAFIPRLFFSTFFCLGICFIEPKFHE